MRVERGAGPLAGAARAVDIVLVDRAVAAERAADGRALHVPDHRPDALAADAQRHLGSRDHDGAREAAAHYRPARPRPRRGTGLRQLVDAALEELLVSAQIRELIGARGRQSGQQGDRGGKPAKRRHRADIPLSDHCSPKTSKVTHGEETRPSHPMILRVSRQSSLACSTLGVFVASWPSCNISAYATVKKQKTGEPLELY